MPTDSSASPQYFLETFQLFDIAEAAAEVEAQGWGEDPGMNLFLDESISLLRCELEEMPAICGARTGERARVWVAVGRLSEAAARIEHYRTIAAHADVWIFGVPDVVFPQVPCITAVPLEPGTSFTRERSVVVEGPSFGAALFGVEAGKLEDYGETSAYFEGYLTAREDVVQQAATRLRSLLKLAPPPPPHR